MFNKLFAKRGLSLERLRALVETVEAGTIAAAVGDDPVRAGQYSRQIGELEQYFGFELAERRGRRLIFNAAGIDLAKKGKEVLTILDSFCGSGKDSEITVTVGAYESIIHWLLLPSMPIFHKKLSFVSWVLRHDPTAEIIRGLKELTLDVGLVRKNAVTPPLKCEHLFKMTYSVFAPKSAIKGLADWRSVLMKMPLAVRQNDGEFWRALESGAAKHQVALKVHLCCVSAVEACKAVSLGQYCSILPSIAAKELDPEKFVALEFPLLKSYERNICLAWNPRITSIRSRMDTVIETLKQELSGA